MVLPADWRFGCKHFCFKPLMKSPRMNMNLILIPTTMLISGPSSGRTPLPKQPQRHLRFFINICVSSSTTISAFLHQHLRFFIDIGQPILTSQQNACRQTRIPRTYQLSDVNGTSSTLSLGLPWQVDSQPILAF
jgi:hypothetical protein